MPNEKEHVNTRVGGDTYSPHPLTAASNLPNSEMTAHDGVAYSFRFQQNAEWHEARRFELMGLMQRLCGFEAIGDDPNDACAIAWEVIKELHEHRADLLAALTRCEVQLQTYAFAHRDMSQARQLAECLDQARAAIAKAGHE